MTKYVYETSTESIIITEEQVDIEWLELLQEEDRKFDNAERRYRHHEPVHYESFNAVDDAIDTNPYLADFGMEPLRFLIKRLNEAEQRELIKKMKMSMAELTPTQQRRLIKLALGMKFSDIARSENVAVNSVKESVEAALKRMRRKIKKI